jgi:hypothetical protein
MTGAAVYDEHVARFLDEAVSHAEQLRPDVRA